MKYTLYVYDKMQNINVHKCAYEFKLVQQKKTHALAMSYRAYLIKERSAIQVQKIK